MKRWKLVKDQLDSKRDASSNLDPARPAPPYMGGGISSSSYLQELPYGNSQYGRSPSTSNLVLPMTKSSSRTSLDIPGRLNNLITKSSSNTDLTSAFKKFPRPRRRTSSNSFIDASPNASPPKISSPRKWVNNLLNQAGPSTEQLETRAQARTRAESDATMSTPAPVSTLVLQRGDAASSSRPVYTIDSGLQRKMSNTGRSASIYSSHLSSASRSTPDLHRNSVTRHLNNGALLMDVSGPLTSIAHRSHEGEDTVTRSALVVRNLDEAPRAAYSAVPAPSASAGLKALSQMRNPFSAQQNRSEEDDDIDASIAHDRSNNQLAPGEQAVLDMLDSMTGASSVPYQTVTPGTLTRPRSFAAATEHQRSWSEYSQDLRSSASGRSSPAAGVREAIRQRELLDSDAPKDSTLRPRLHSTRSALQEKASAYLNTAGAKDVETLRTGATSSSTYHHHHAQAHSQKISRVAVPTTEIRLQSPPTTSASTAFPRRANQLSPIDSSLLSTSVNATSLWSKPGNAPDTPSSTQDLPSPMPWSSASEQAPKWPISGHYAVEPVVTPIEMKGERRLEALQPVKPNMHRQQTNFTEATSVSSGSGGFGASQGSLQKENVAEAEGTDAALKNTAAQHPTSAVISRPLSFVGSNSSSLAAARKAAIPPTSQSRPTSAIFGSTSSVAAVARELQQRSNTPSRPSSPEKFASSSPTKAKDLIAMFESSSATASPSSELARNVTPKSKLKRGVVDVDPPLRRQTPLGVSVARSNVGLADESPVSGKLRAQRDDAGGVRVRPAGMVILDDDANVPANADDGSDENAAPGSVISATRSASGRFRSHGSNSQHSQQQSTKAPSVSSPIATPTKRAPGDVLGKGVVSGSPARKPSFRNSVLGFLTGKPTSTSLETPVSSATLGPTLLTQRRNSAQSDAAQSTASIATTGTVASYRHLVETGNLPLTTTTAISMTHTPPGTPPLRSGVLYYFNVHDAHPRWLRVKAVLLPSAVAMSWIPVGGGRENVVLDLRACREVHSVPSPDHPSSAEDVGATAARSQGLDGITPFQMIFDDGVERLAADSARERVVWVAAVWDVVGAGAGRVESDGGSIMVDAGHDQVSARSGSNEEAIERIGSVWKSELSSAMTDNVQPSFGVAMTIAAANVAPPVPPKEVSAAPAAASRVARALPTPTLAVASSTAAAASSTPPATSTSSPRPKARTWQRPPLDPLTDPIHDPTSKQTIVHPTTAAKSTPASHASSSAVSSSHTAKTTTSSIPSSPELAGYASARSTPTLDEFGPRSPVTEAHFHWSSLDKESDLHPSDSASQRPARSELGSISSDERTPAQMLRDAVMGDRLGTVVEETLSQTQYTQLNVRTRSEVSDASISSREVNALLSLLEDQQRARASKERELEEQIKGFQEAVESLQRKSSIPRSLVAGDGGSELAKMQERLGRVLDLVSAPPAHGRVRSEASVSLGDETDVEDVLARVLRRMQVEDGVGSDMVRGVSAPGQSSTAMNAGDTRRRLSASLPGTSDLDATSALSRLPPRSWTSSKGVPSPPPNSERDARSLLDRPASRATLDSRAPAQNFRMLADPTSAAAPRPLMVEPSYGTLDMEAEIRRRRAAASGAEGGWYTPKVEGLESTCSVTAEDMNVNLDKPVPPTPSVRFAPSDIAPAPTVPGTSGAGLVAMPAVDQTTNTELATILQALHQTEQARLTQAQQQTEISRYLNELNAWLERDVVDRSHEWKTLASGVTQLADELRALKEGRTLPAATTPVTPIELGDAPAEAGDEGKKGKKEKELVTLGNKAVRRKPAGTRYFNSSERETKENDWYRPASPVEREPTLKSRAAKVAAAAGGALMIRHALSEWDKFKSTRREAGLAESPLPEEATGDTGNDSQLPLPEPVLAQLKDAADKEDKEKVGEVVKEAAEKGYGTQAIIELTKHVESKDAADEKDDEELPTEAKEEEDDGVTKMATPVPARVAAKEKAKPDAADAKEGDAVESKDAADVGPSTAALATAVEEILKHLLVTKEEASKKASSPATLDAKDKTELVDLLYTRLAADKAAEEAKAKDLDPKTAIESLVVAINAQKENELRAAAAADAAMRQLTSDLLKTASEQNSKLVEAVAAASRDMLRQNVQQHADEFKRLLHAEVTGMFEDVGRIREAKRHLEFEIADLWGIKNRHLQGAGGGLGGYGTPGGIMAPTGPMSMPVPMHHPPAKITAMPAGPPVTRSAPAPAGPPKQAPTAPPRAAPTPAPRQPAAAPPAAPAQAQKPAPPPVTVTKNLPRRKDVVNPFAINFGPRAPASR